MHVKIHTPNSFSDVFVIELVTPRNRSQLDAVLDLFGEELGIRLVSYSSSYSTIYKLGIEDKHQFVRMVNTLFDHMNPNPNSAALLSLVA